MLLSNIRYQGYLSVLEKDMNYKDLDGWKYIRCIADGADTRRLRKMLAAKYRGISIRFDPLEYELSVLADAITGEPGYSDLYGFLGTHDLRYQKAIMTAGLDYYIRKKERKKKNPVQGKVPSKKEKQHMLCCQSKNIS